MDSRLEQLKSWAQQFFPDNGIQLVALTKDASFRKFYRVSAKEESYILMDSPPDKENNEDFILIAKALLAAGLQVPEIFNYDLEQGFILESDLGDALISIQLNEETVDEIYSCALKTLIKLQNAENYLQKNISSFNEYIYKELMLFDEWFIRKYLNLHLSETQHHILQSTYKRLYQTLSDQPQVLTHRDYHSRNLLLHQNQIAMVDFQDAVFGPITYDAVSLLKDCYIDWPEEKVNIWALDYLKLLNSQNKLSTVSPETFLFWFDLTGLQRHLKVLGIFTRLYLRDDNRNYLKYLDRILTYVVSVSSKYKILDEFYELFITVITRRLFEVHA